MDNEVKIQFKNEISNLDQLEKYRDTLRNIYFLLTDKAVYRISKTSQKAKEAENETGKVSKSLDKIAKQNSIAFNYNALGTFVNKLKQLTKVMAENVSKSSTYYENLNLLKVAYKGNITEAQKFVNTLTEMYGLDESWGYRTVGIFKQLSNAMGLTDKIGEKVAKTMTSFAIDTSSLYNIGTNDAVSIITSALAGQTKPARRLGADITQATLQQTLINAGIDKSINKLNYAEKRLVIIASLLTQVKEATNDWNKTIESPANQTRILNEQWERLTRTLGDIFLPIIYKILPYLNAVVMVLVEIGKIIASIMQKIFGFNPKKDLDFGAGVATEIEDIVDNINGIGDSSSSAANNVKKLKNELLGLRSFDQLINLTTPTSSSKNKSGSSSGTGLGISDDILNLANKAMDEYNKKLEYTGMKATKIRDKIMEWLGFTKEVDEKTGEISWKFDHITSGTVLGALAVGGSIFIGIMRIYSILKKIGILNFGFISPLTKLVEKIGSATFTSALSLLKNISFTKLTSALPTILKNLPLIALIIGEIQVLLTDKDLQKTIREIKKTIGEILKDLKDIGKELNPYINYKTTFDGIKASLEGISQILSVLGDSWNLFIDLLSNLNEISFSNLLTGLNLIKDLLRGDLNAAVKDVVDGLLRLSDSRKKLVSKLFDSGSGKFWSDVKKDIEDMENGTYGKGELPSFEKKFSSFKELSNILDSFNEKIEDTTGVYAFSTTVENLTKKLLGLVNANGKVDKSNQAVAQYLINTLNKELGTEYKLKNGIITLNGKEIKSNKELKDSIQQVIDKKKVEILLDGYKEDYINALKEEQNHQQRINELNEEYSKIQYLGGIEGVNARNKIIAEYAKEKEAMDKNQKTISDYDTLIKASASNNAKDIQKAIKTYGVETSSYVKSSFDTIGTEAQKTKNKLKQVLGKFSIEIDANTDKFITSISQAFNSIFGGEKGQKKLQGYGEILKALFKADGGVYAGGQWHNIQRYDGGGMPQTGQLFWARENGLPEMVGQIGGHTAVMNNDQIVGSVANGVYKATREALANTGHSKTPQIYNFYLDKNHKLATYTLEELQSMARNNGKAITIA